MELVIGQQYRWRYIGNDRKRHYQTVTLLAINSELMRKDQIASVTVVRDGGTPIKVNHLTLEPVEA